MKSESFKNTVRLPDGDLCTSTTMLPIKWEAVFALLTVSGWQVKSWHARIEDARATMVDYVDVEVKQRNPILLGARVIRVEGAELVEDQVVEEEPALDPDLKLELNMPRDVAVEILRTYFSTAYSLRLELKTYESFSEKAAMLGFSTDEYVEMLIGKAVGDPVAEARTVLYGRKATIAGPRLCTSGAGEVVSSRIPDEVTEVEIAVMGPDRQGDIFVRFPFGDHMRLTHIMFSSLELLK